MGHGLLTNVMHTMPALGVLHHGARIGAYITKPALGTSQCPHWGLTYNARIDVLHRDAHIGVLHDNAHIEDITMPALGPYITMPALGSDITMPELAF